MVRLKKLRRKHYHVQRSATIESDGGNGTCILVHVASNTLLNRSQDREDCPVATSTEETVTRDCSIPCRRSSEKMQRSSRTTSVDTVQSVYLDNNNKTTKIRPRSHTVAGILNNKFRFDDFSVSPLIIDNNQPIVEEEATCVVQRNKNGGTTTIPVDGRDSERSRASIGSHPRKPVRSISMQQSSFGKFAEESEKKNINTRVSCPALNKLQPQPRSPRTIKSSAPQRKTGIFSIGPFRGFRTRSQSSAEDKGEFGSDNSSSMEELAGMKDSELNRSDDQLWRKRRNSNEDEGRDRSQTFQHTRKNCIRRRHLLLQRGDTYSSENESNERGQFHPLTPPLLHRMKFPSSDLSENMEGSDILEGETEEDAAIRRAALAARSSARRGSEVVHIPTASIRMDLHTLYLEAIGNKGKGRRSDTSPILRRKRFLTGSQGNLFRDGNDDERRSPWTFFRQKFGQKKFSFCDDLREFLDHCRENSLEQTSDDLEKYRNEHWTSLLSERAESPDSQRGHWERDIKDKRCEAIWELFHAEVVYLLDHLLVLQDVFYRPLENAREAGFLITIEPETIFGNLQQLINVTTKFVRRLIAVFEDQTTPGELCSVEGIVKAFTEFNFDASPEYQVYCVNYSKLRGNLTGLKSNEDFREFVRWCESDVRCNRLRLSDLLVAPFQHLTKYPLLLKAIRKRTLPTDSYYDALTSTIDAVEKSIKELEGKVSFVSNVERIQEINSSIIWPSIVESESKPFIPDFLKNELAQQPCQSLLENPCRVLLLEGTLTLVEGNKVDLHIFLFDDMILMTKVKRSAVSKSLRRRHFSVSQFEVNNYESPRISRKTISQEQTQQMYIVYRQPISLDRFSLHEEKQVNGNVTLRNAFCIVQYSRFKQVIAVYTFQAATNQEKAKWTQALLRAQATFLEGSETSDTEDDSKSDTYYNDQDSS